MSGAVYARFLGGPWHDQVRIIECRDEYRVVVMSPITLAEPDDVRAWLRTAFYQRLGSVRAQPPNVYELMMYVGTRE